MIIFPSKEFGIDALQATSSLPPSISEGSRPGGGFSPEQQTILTARSGVTYECAS